MTSLRYHQVDEDGDRNQPGSLGLGPFLFVLVLVTGLSLPEVRNARNVKGELICVLVSCYLSSFMHFKGTQLAGS